ncbi:hypothetical protein [Clostridium sp.]|uniref:hypothetical protein n=1 Tax=Clostridium sp. TaxID=1506 RepID=UPI002FDE4DC3
MKIIKLIKNYIEDILIISGLLTIIGATFLVSKIIGIYALGIVLLSLGIYFAKYPKEVNK